MTRKLSVGLVALAIEPALQLGPNTRDLVVLGLHVERVAPLEPSLDAAADLPVGITEMVVDDRVVGSQFVRRWFAGRWSAMVGLQVVVHSYFGRWSLACVTLAAGLQGCRSAGHLFIVIRPQVVGPSPVGRCLLVCWSLVCMSSVTGLQAAGRWSTVVGRRVVGH